MAAPFDPVRVELTGPIVPVVDDVAIERGGVGWTPQRILAFGQMDEPLDGVSRSSIVAVQGSESKHVVGPGDTWGGRLSPDGRPLAYYAPDSGYFEIFVTAFPDTTRGG